MLEQHLVKKVFRMAAIVVALAIAIKVSFGYFSILIVLAGVVWANQGKVGRALCCYVTLPFFVIFNGYILPISMPLIMSARLGVLVIGLVLIASANRRLGTYKVPLALIFLYIVSATISSLCGYCPNVSIMKLINFSIFIAGLNFGCRNLDQKPLDLMTLRAYLLGMGLVLGVGSLLVLPFPAIAYSTSSTYLVAEYGVEAASEIMKLRGTEAALFSGLTSHSQTLAPEAAMVIVFVLADMFFVERRMTWLHGFILSCVFACLFMTRSRTGLVAACIGITMLCWVTAKKVRIPTHMRRRVKSLMSGFFICVVLLAIASEISSHTMTRWLRKGDYEDSGKTMMEAVTSSRMGAVEELLRDFRQSPLIGMGFQVNAMSARFRKQTFVWSAPVEKGLLPMVIIGEGGILGVITFGIFLCAFFVGCARQKMHVTALTFTTLLATNMGEATFFSPGAVGGILWVYGIIGGLTLDSLTRARVRMEVMNVGYMPPSRMG